MRRIAKYSLIVLAGGFATGLAVVAYSSLHTEAVIRQHMVVVEATGRTAPSPTVALADLDHLPAPVQRYFRFAFPEPPRPLAFVRMTMAGDFRRPRTEGFAPTTAEQTVAAGVPALAFAATTPIVPGVWARAYDAYAHGEMEMKAKILSTLTVVDERETPALNRTSLRRWLLESPLYPEALLPGGPVRWEVLDRHRARAVVSYRGVEASLVASFREDGSLERLDAEQDGDLDTPYHGSGEHVAREDYRLVAGAMRPMGFVIARVAGGEIHPFWRGRVTALEAVRP